MILITFRKTLDLSLSMRFSGLPNNVTLEMEELEVQREKEFDIVTYSFPQTNLLE